jgi:branched-chain amino acid transport system ATP-binding protein
MTELLNSDQSNPILQVSNLTKYFGGVVATDHVDLQIWPGKIHALIGPNGAGKTTLIHQISGAIMPDEGRVKFDGSDVTNIPMYERAQKGLVRTYQITSIFLNLSVLDNLAIALVSKTGGGFHFWTPARLESNRYERAGEIAKRIGLGTKAHLLANSLSHGEQRQLEVGIALAVEPKLLLLDEPMAGLGPGESEGMLELLKSLCPAVTVLLVEHDMDAVFKLADSISALVFGKVIATGTPQQIKNHAGVREAYLGDDSDF